MFRIAFRQIYRDWKTVLAIFVTMLVTAILLTAFVVLSASAIHHVILGSRSPLEDPKGPMIIFNVIGGITVIIAVLVITMIITQSVRRRQTHFARLRVLGVTYRQTKNLVYAENFFMLACAFAIGAPLGLLTSNFIRDFMVSRHALENAFTAEWVWYYPFIALSICVLVTAFVSWVAMFAHKRIAMSPKRLSWFRLAWRIFIGLACFGGALTMLLLRSLMQGSLGAGLIVNAVFLLVISFAIIGPWVIKFFYLTLIKIGFGRPRIFGLALRSSAAAARVLTPSICMIVAGVLTTYTATEMNGMIAQAKVDSIGNIYQNIQSGIAFGKKQLKDTDADISTYMNPTTTAMTTTRQVSSPSLPDKMTVRGIESSSGTMIYQMTSVAGDVNNLFGNATHPIIMSSAKAKSMPIGTPITLTMDNQPFVFTLAGTYAKPAVIDEDGKDVENEVLADAYINIDDLRHLPISQSFFQIKYIMASDRSLEPLYKSEIVYNPMDTALFGIELSRSLSLMFAAIFGIYIAIVGINSIGIYVADKRREFSLLRVVAATTQEVVRQVVYECLVFVLMTMALILSSVVIIAYAFTSANDMAFTVTVNPSLFTALLAGAILLMCVAFAVPIAAMTRSIRRNTIR